MNLGNCECGQPAMMTMEINHLQSGVFQDQIGKLHVCAVCKDKYVKLITAICEFRGLKLNDKSEN